mgnify:CR=1 FL=1
MSVPATRVAQTLGESPTWKYHRPMKDLPRRLDGIDIGMLAATVCTLGGLAVFTLTIVPRFVDVYRELGVELPWVTRIAIQGWTVVLSGLLSILLSCLGVGIRLGSSRLRAARWVLLCAAALPLAAVALMWLSLYYPIFAIAP